MQSAKHILASLLFYCSILAAPLANSVDPNTRPGTWVTYHRESSSYEGAVQACHELANEIREIGRKPIRFKQQSFSQVGSIFACNLDAIEYLPLARDYLRLSFGNDFDLGRSDDQAYLQQYFRSDLDKLNNDFHPFPVTILRHRVSPQSKHVFFYYQVEFPEEYVPTLITEKIWVDDSRTGAARSEGDAIAARDYLESVASALYNPAAFMILNRGVDRFVQSTPNGFVTVYRGWIEYLYRASLDISPAPKSTPLSSEPAGRN